MFDTTDLTSYIPGYDDYCEPEKENLDIMWELTDNYHDDYMCRGGCKIMHREKIKISESELTIEEMSQLYDYVWQGDYLIPIEMIEGE
jgi:hypothetical protein